MPPGQTANGEYCRDAFLSGTPTDMIHAPANVQAHGVPSGLCPSQCQGHAQSPEHKAPTARRVGLRRLCFDLDTARMKMKLSDPRMRKTWK